MDLYTCEICGNFREKDQLLQFLVEIFNFVAIFPKISHVQVKEKTFFLEIALMLKKTPIFLITAIFVFSVSEKKNRV